ncbi:hypothetical protein EJ04DRAFT_45086 [Polyplosphaeria fusca]|uniref:Uncharacterized protein n=1 Tax=Polyplosphaeria fusca TaxID=682080 RepID=A0A9P4R3V9_9PLEO|nr:hypothetical protein EJ04DRAFT_45086 [Polyplosphaeria fusca]
MPMNWTAENDRILLMKLIETHGIAVNAEMIAKAWPDNEVVKPTARAIKERFVKIRALVADDNPNTPKAKMTKAAPTSGRMSLSNKKKVPSTSTKKRKVETQVFDSDSDAEGHVTPPEQETPSRPRPIANGKPRQAKPHGRVAVENEPSDDLFPGLAQQASEAQDNFIQDYILSSPSYAGGLNNGDINYGNGNGVNGNSMSVGVGQNMNMNGMNGQDMTNMNGQTTYSGYAMSPTTQTPHSLSLSDPPCAPDFNAMATDTTPRARSTRNASQAANQNMAAWRQNQMDMDRENGDKTSEGDDSEDSQFDGSEVEEI